MQGPACIAACRQRSTRGDHRSLVGYPPKESLHSCRVTAVVLSDSCSDSTCVGRHSLCPLLTTSLIKSRSFREPTATISFRYVFPLDLSTKSFHYIFPLYLSTISLHYIFPLYLSTTLVHFSVALHSRHHVAFTPHTKRTCDICLTLIPERMSTPM